MTVSGAKAGAGIAGAIVAGFLIAGPAAAEDLQMEVRAALDTIFAALMTGDAGTVRPLLAPEFQIMRSNGAGYGREDYLARSLPRIETPPVFDDVVVTRNGDIVVVRLRIGIEEYLDGMKAESVFPHLFVFRVTDEGWQVIAAANFARLESRP